MAKGNIMLIIQNYSIINFFFFFFFEAATHKFCVTKDNNKPFDSISIYIYWYIYICIVCVKKGCDLNRTVLVTMFRIYYCNVFLFFFLFLEYWFTVFQILTILQYKNLCIWSKGFSIYFYRVLFTNTVGQNKTYLALF